MTNLISTDVLLEQAKVLEMVEADLEELWDHLTAERDDVYRMGDSLDMIEDFLARYAVKDFKAWDVWHRRQEVGG